MNYLVSYPRSGNTAVRLFLERYTGMPVHGAKGPRGGSGKKIIIPKISRSTKYDIISERKKGEKDGSLLYPWRKDFIMYKVHDIYKDMNVFTSKDKIVFLIRNYKDAIFSFLKYDGNHPEMNPCILNSISDKQYLVLEKEIFHKTNIYCMTIKAFDMCKSQKIMVRYENLLSNSFREFSRILSFLDIELYSERIKSCNTINKRGKEDVDKWFMADLGKGIKNRLNQGMQFKGRYKKCFRKSTIEKMEEIVKNELGLLYSKYCKIYEE